MAKQELETRENIPEIPQGNVTSVTAAIESFRRAISCEINVLAPVAIKKNDIAKRFPTVVPLVKYGYRKTTGECGYLDRDEFGIHANQGMTCGGMTVEWPFFKGDTGFVLACDYDTSNIVLALRKKLRHNNILSTRFKSEENDYVFRPDTIRVHDFQFGVFFPCSYSECNLGEVKDFIDSEDRLQIYDDESGKCDMEVYLGTSVNTDKNTPYRSKPSCHIGMKTGFDGGNSKVLFAVSGADGKGKAVSKLKDDEYNLKVKDEDAGVDFELGLKLGDGTDFSMKDDVRTIKVEQDGVFSFVGGSDISYSATAGTSNLKVNGVGIAEQSFDVVSIFRGLSCGFDFDENIACRIGGISVNAKNDMAITFPGNITTHGFGFSADIIVINANVNVTGESCSLSGDNNKFKCPGFCHLQRRKEPSSM